ncbi:Ubiquitin C-terminal hydrolase 13-like protein [Drosera capensis]
MHFSSTICFETKMILSGRNPFAVRSLFSLSQVELSHPDAELRMLEVFYHKIYKIFPSNEKREHINGRYWTLRAEEIPEEEKNLGPQDRLIHVYHFTKELPRNQMVENFGDPFFLLIHAGETLAEIKSTEVQKKLQVPDEELSKGFTDLLLIDPLYVGRLPGSVRDAVEWDWYPQLWDVGAIGHLDHWIFYLFNGFCLFDGLGGAKALSLAPLSTSASLY